MQLVPIHVKGRPEPRAIFISRVCPNAAHHSIFNGSPQSLSYSRGPTNKNKLQKQKQKQPKAKSKAQNPRPVLKTPKKQTRQHEGLLSGVGGVLGSAFGPSGAVIGAAAGDLLGNLFGWGDYEETAPVNYPIVNNSLVGMQTPLAAQIPMMHGEDGSCRIKKREYITDIQMSVLFNPGLWALNPIDARTFPWLSKVASQFEQYKFLGLAFGFRSLTANALGTAGNPSMGSVTIMTQYDFLDNVVTTKTQANNALFATSCKPSESMLHPCECDPEQTPNLPLYTGINERVGAYGPGDNRDLRLNYLGYVTVATQGAPIAYNAGELWVTYDIMLYKPMVQQPIIIGSKPPRSAAEILGLYEPYEKIDCDPPTLSRDPTASISSRVFGR